MKEPVGWGVVGGGDEREIGSLANRETETFIEYYYSDEI